MKEKSFGSIGNAVNKLPFVKLSEKYLGKIGILNKIIPYANFIVCGFVSLLIVLVIVLKVSMPQVKFNKWIKAVDETFMDMVNDYKSIDVSAEYNKTLEELSLEINKCSNDRKGLKELESLKNNVSKIDDKNKDLFNKSTEILNKCSVRLSEIGTLDFALSNEMLERYQKTMEKSNKRNTEAMETFTAINHQMRKEFLDKFDEIYIKKLTEINEAIAEADRQAYFNYLKTTMVGKWKYKDSNVNAELVFKANGEYSYSYHKDANKYIAIDPLNLWDTHIDEYGYERLGHWVTEPEGSMKYSGTYTMPENIVTLKIDSFSNTNMPNYKVGDTIKFKINISNSKILYFDGKGFTRK